MTTAAGEYIPLRLPPQFAALAVADPTPEPSFPLPPTSSTSPGRGGDVVTGDANAGGRRGVAAAADADSDVAPTRKAWRSPRRRLPDHGEVVFMEELGSAWPVPSRGVPSHKKKLPQSSPEGALGNPFAAAAATADSSQWSVSATGPIARSAAIGAAVDPVQKQREEKAVGIWGAEMQSTGPVAVAAASRTDLLPYQGNSNPRSPRPPLRPAGRQQQARPPMQSGHRGRSPQHFLGNGGGHQQQRPRHQRNSSFFPHQQHAQVISDYGYQSAMMSLLNPTPEWGFNTGSNVQWGPSPQIAPPRMNTLAPPENLFVRGYFPGPYFPEGLSYAAPFPPIVRPPVGQNPPWFMGPPPPPTEATLRNQPAHSPLPLDDHQLLPEITQPEAENVSMRLRKQIEYYFSDQNLVKDVYLRTCMDTEGWISVHTIANFPRVQSLTKDVGLILAALQTSPTVEVSGDKMRKKGEWSRWIIRRQPLLDANRGEPRRDD